MFDYINFDRALTVKSILSAMLLLQISAAHYAGVTVKISTPVVFGFLIAFNTNVYAFGLGKIDVKSALNEPFEATIELTGTLDFNEEQAVVQLGSANDFERMGMTRENILLQLNFELDLKSKPAVINIRSSKAIDEPALDFILSVQSPQAQMMKSYTVFLNPAQ